MENKKSIFEKLGLVNNVNNYPKDEKSQRTDEASKKEESSDIFRRRNRESKAEVDRYVSIEDIYKAYNADTDKKESIYMVDEFSKALPENLDEENRKRSVQNIVKVLGTRIEDFVEDGNKRADILNKFLNNFTDKTDEIISNNEMEIDALTKKINEYKDAIEQRKKLQREQKSSVEKEIGKIEDIIEFIDGKKTASDKEDDKKAESESVAESETEAEPESGAETEAAEKEPHDQD